MEKQDNTNTLSELELFMSLERNYEELSKKIKLTSFFGTDLFYEIFLSIFNKFLEKRKMYAFFILKYHNCIAVGQMIQNKYTFQIPTEKEKMLHKFHVAVFYGKKDYYKCLKDTGVGLLKGQNILHIPYKVILDLESNDKIHSSNLIEYLRKNVPGSYLQ